MLKYKNKPNDPLILGRPSLATAGVIIDVKEGQIRLNIGDIPMIFDMEKLIKRPLNDSQVFYVDDILELAEESFADLCSDNPLENELSITEKEMFSIDGKTDESTRLMNTSDDITDTEEEENMNLKLMSIDTFNVPSIDNLLR